MRLEGLLQREAGGERGLDCRADWASILSLGEQQRLAFTRREAALLHFIGLGFRQRLDNVALRTLLAKCSGVRLANMFKSQTLPRSALQAPVCANFIHARCRQATLSVQTTIHCGEVRG